MAKKKKVVKVFHSAECVPCHEIINLIKEARFVVDIDADVEIVDVTSEDGFPDIEKEKVEKIPSAKLEGRSCRLGIDEEYGIAVISCGEEIKDAGQ